MRSGTIGLLIAAVLSITTSTAYSQTAPTLTSSQAAAISPHYGNRPCRQDIDDLIQRGSWASFMHTCHGDPVGSNSIAHYANGRWTILCGHGDDVLPAEMAVSQCPGLTLSEAIAIGMPPQNPEHYDLSDPVQVVEKYYALWNQRGFSEMYSMLSTSYRSAHPYAGWLTDHASTGNISAQAASGSASGRVQVTIYSSDTATPRDMKSYAGTWILTKSSGSWRLDSVTLKAVPLPH
jgi:hypothetical protein